MTRNAGRNPVTLLSKVAAKRKAKLIVEGIVVYCWKLLSKLCEEG